VSLLSLHLDETRDFNDAPVSPLSPTPARLPLFPLFYRPRKGKLPWQYWSRHENISHPPTAMNVARAFHIQVCWVVWDDRYLVVGLFPSHIHARSVPCTSRNALLVPYTAKRAWHAAVDGTAQICRIFMPQVYGEAVPPRSASTSIYLLLARTPTTREAKALQPQEFSAGRCRCPDFIQGGHCETLSDLAWILRPPNSCCRKLNPVHHPPLRNRFGFQVQKGSQQKSRVIHSFLNSSTALTCL